MRSSTAPSGRRRSSRPAFCREANSRPSRWISQGAPHILYLESEDDGYLRYATRPGSSWEIGNIDNERFSGWGDIAVGPEDDLHIARHNYSSSDLRYSKQSSTGAWQTGVVAPGGRWPQIAIETTGRLHLAGSDVPGGVFYATRTGSTWNEVSLDELGALEGAFGEFTRMAIGPDGRGPLSPRFTGSIRICTTSFTTERAGGGAWVSSGREHRFDRSGCRERAAQSRSSTATRRFDTPA